ncbi:MAG: efflux RND transporter periplasmic adaptor subunit [Caldimonas sp.]
MSLLRPAIGAAILLGAAAPALAVDFDCIIEPAQVVEIRSPVVGIVERVHARRGDLVNKGDVLVTIESSVEQSAADAARFRSQAQGGLQLARTKLAAAKEKARRMQELSEEQFVSAQARDDAAAELKLAEAELRTAEENTQLAKLEHRQSVDQLNRRVLRSPFNGVVMDQYLFPGALVDAGDTKKPILKLAQTQPLLAQAILPFRYFPEVKVGEAVTVIPEKPFKGEVATRIRTVDRVIDSAAGTFGVVAEIPNTQRDLPGGIRCKLRLGGVAAKAP